MFDYMYTTNTFNCHQILEFITNQFTVKALYMSHNCKYKDLIVKL